MTMTMFRTVATCPICERPDQVELADGWQDMVETQGEVIPIIGCGNPWHYQGLEVPTYALWFDAT